MFPSPSVPAACRRARAPHRLPWFAVMALLACTAQADAPARKPSPDPLDPQASVPALRYESSLKPSLRPADDKPLSWREANDTAARIGGWRVYAREAQQPEPAPEAATMPALPPGPAGRPQPSGARP